MRKAFFGVAVVAAILSLAGCKTALLAPPVVELPAPTVTAQPLELTRWWVVFGDAALDRLIDEALKSNVDLEAAMARIEQARANVLIAQSDLYPSVNLDVGVSRNRLSEIGSQPLPAGVDSTTSSHRVGIAASYELDLWGKFRTATRAAQRQLLATRYARETVQTTVAADVARAYFAVLAADAELGLLRDTLGTRAEAVWLQRDRFEAGVVGGLDLRQAEAERAAVLADIARTQQVIARFESALAVLVGRPPREVFRPVVDRDTDTQRLLVVPVVEAGLPSGLLERRPDIQQVEAELTAADLRIDVARADYFPSITLTGTFGSESALLKNLFSGPALAWGIGAQLLQPIVGVKAIEANVAQQTARRNEVVAVYRKTVQTAFKETYDALVSNRTSREALAAETLRRGELAHALELADLRYRGGYSAYLEVLDAQRQLLSADRLRIIAARDARVALVDLARALGGGWAPDSIVR
ncbi:MAG TPA: efflux transporter outer membrane subunit [Casimicrobiaceae bacterium]|nr:efflux transporter outer membrane subunit [Casimicrobiaceae bacterium]